MPTSCERAVPGSAPPRIAAGANGTCNHGCHRDDFCRLGHRLSAGGTRAPRLFGAYVRAVSLLLIMSLWACGTAAAAPSRQPPALGREEPAHAPDASFFEGAAWGNVPRGDPDEDRRVSMSTRSSRTRPFIVHAAARALALVPPAAPAQSAAVDAAAAGHAGPGPHHDAWLREAGASRHGFLLPHADGGNHERAPTTCARPHVAEEDESWSISAGKRPEGQPCKDGGGQHRWHPCAPSPTRHTETRWMRSDVPIGYCEVLGPRRQDAVGDVIAQGNVWPTLVPFASDAPPALTRLPVG